MDTDIDTLQPSDGFLGTDEVAARLDISTSTVRRLIKRGQLDCIHDGGVWRIPAASVERYIETHVGAPITERPSLEDRLAGLPLLLTVAQVGDLIGMSEWNVRRLCREGHLHHVRFGGSIRIPLGVIVEYLSVGRAA